MRCVGRQLGVVGYRVRLERGENVPRLEKEGKP